MSEEMNKSAESESRWYVVHTYSGYENKVKANIEKIVENRGMQDQIHEVSVPVQDVVEVKNGQKKNCSEKNLPRLCPYQNVYERGYLVRCKKHKGRYKLCRP